MKIQDLKVSLNQDEVLGDYLKICSKNIEDGQKYHGEIVAKVFQAVSLHATVLGAVAALGFSALDHVFNPIFFFGAQTILFILIIYCLYIIKTLSVNELKELSGLYVYYLNKRDEINKAILDSDLDKKQSLSTEVIVKSVGKMTTMNHSYIYDSANKFDREIKIVLWITGLAFMFLLVSFIPIFIFVEMLTLIKSIK